MDKIYPLEIDPRILELLGPNLYTNIYYVLAELVANAYDADAKNVYIIAEKDSIRVEDDGHGMSYIKGEIDKYLSVAKISRVEESDSFSRSGERRKMGRKGVGKLAALSVSENVDVMTVSDGERSGFVLSRRPPGDGKKLTALSESEINFVKIHDNGTAVVMRNPQYSLHRTIEAIKRNLLKIFPLVGSDFRIHLFRGDEKDVIDDFDRSIVPQLGALITLGKDFHRLHEYAYVKYPEKKADLFEERKEHVISVGITDNQGQNYNHLLEIHGWIGVYQSTKGRKAEMTDFPDNFISLFANKKLGEFNILPFVGQNRLNEVYVVGQLHADLFERSDLPDMALSNRQGYKTEDKRYAALLDYVRKDLLTAILKKREVFADRERFEKDKRKLEEQRSGETELKNQVDSFRKKASEHAASELHRRGSSLPIPEITEIVRQSIIKSSPDLGIKSIVDSQKKKILISHASGDKDLSDVVCKMLIFNGAAAEDILYSSSEDEVLRPPESEGVLDYLRDFFVNSYSDKKIFVVFVTSEHTVSWYSMLEVGAAWITQADHKVFNVPPFLPSSPLNVSHIWQITNRDSESSDLWVDPKNADTFCVKIEKICDHFGYKRKSRSQNMAFLSSLISIIPN